MRRLPYYVDTEVQFLITASFSFQSKKHALSSVNTQICKANTILFLIVQVSDVEVGFVGGFIQRMDTKYTKRRLSPSEILFGLWQSKLASFFAFITKGESAQATACYRNWRLKTEQKGKKE